MQAARLEGWLDAVPKSEGHKPWPHSRRAEYRKQGLEPPTIEIDAGHYLFAALAEAGPVKLGSMGEIPLEWVDVYAYSQATQAVVEAWEMSTLIQLSGAYLAGRIDGEEPRNSIPPMDREKD